MKVERGDGRERANERMDGGRQERKHGGQTDRRSRSQRRGGRSKYGRSRGGEAFAATMHVSRQSEICSDRERTEIEANEWANERRRRRPRLAAARTLLTRGTFNLVQYALGRKLEKYCGSACTMGNDPDFSGKNQIPLYCISGILRIYG